MSSFKEILSGFFPWDLPVVKISPEWVTGPEQGKSSGRIATFSLWTGMFRDGISSIYLKRLQNNTWITNEINITTILEKLLQYKKNWIQLLNRTPRDRLPRVMKHYSPTGRRHYGRSLKRLLDMWDRNGFNKWPNCMTDIWWWWTYVNILDNYNIIEHSSVCNKLSN